jgi:hypothetical protein
VSSGMLRRVALVRTDVSEEPSASFIRMTRIGELETTLAATSNRRTLREQEPHGVTSQKTPFFIVTTVKTSNLIQKVWLPTMAGFVSPASNLCVYSHVYVSLIATIVHNGTINALPRQRKIVGCVIFYVVRVISKKSVRSVLTSSYLRQTG